MRKESIVIEIIYDLGFFFSRASTANLCRVFVARFCMTEISMIFSCLNWKCFPSCLHICKLEFVKTVFLK